MSKPGYVRMVLLKGAIYASECYQDTLKEFMEVNRIKRSQIAAWWWRSI